MSRPSKILIALNGEAASFAWPDAGPPRDFGTWELLAEGWVEAKKLISTYDRIVDVVLDERPSRVTLILEPKPVDERPEPDNGEAPGEAEGRRDAAAEGGDREGDGATDIEAIKYGDCLHPAQQRASCLRKAHDALLLLLRGEEHGTKLVLKKPCEGNKATYLLAAWAVFISHRDEFDIGALINRADLDACMVEKTEKNLDRLSEAEHDLTQLVRRLLNVVREQHEEDYSVHKNWIEKKYLVASAEL